MAIAVRKVSMSHRSGTKEYHLLLIVNADEGTGILVSRWGKAGTWGQMKSEKGSASDCLRAFNAKQYEKESRGYRSSFDKSEQFVSADDAKPFIGMTYWPQIGAANLQHVFPGVDTSGVREAKPAVWKEKEGGGWERDEKPEHSMPSKEDEIAEAKANPNWGLF